MQLVTKLKKNDRSYIGGKNIGIEKLKILSKNNFTLKLDSSGAMAKLEFTIKDFLDVLNGMMDGSIDFESKNNKKDINIIDFTISIKDLENKIFPENLCNTLVPQINENLNNGKLKNAIINYEFIYFYLDNGELVWEEGESEEVNIEEKSQIIVKHIGDEENFYFDNLGIEPSISKKYLDKLMEEAINGITYIKNKLSEEEKQISAYVNMYYLTVDSKDIKFYKNLYQLYGENIEYNRCDLKLKGKKDFKKFFEERFNSLDIKHEIETIIPLDNKVYVKGSFSGKNIRLDKDISGDFVDVHTFSNEKKLEDRKIIDRRTYLSDGTLKQFYENFQIDILTEADIIESKILKESEANILTEYFCVLEKDEKDVTYEYTKHKFMKMGYGIEVIKGTNKEGKEVNTIRFMNLQNGEDMYFDSSVGSEIIK